VSKFLSVDVIDAGLDKFATAVKTTLCSAQPANFAGIAAVALASVTRTAGTGNGSYTKANGDTSGRKLTIAAVSTVTVAVSGTCTYVAYDDGTTLLGVAESEAKALTAGGTVALSSHKLEIQAPT
jgi:hypothetical protein